MLSCKIATTSSCVASSGTPSTLTRGVRISVRLRSSNSSMLFFSRSPSSSFMPPSCCTSSTSVSSSSCEKVRSFSKWNTRHSSFFHPENTAFMGLSTTSSTRMTGVTAMAKFSGISLATLLGVISPKISTTTVHTIVETVGPEDEPSRFTNITVPIEAIEILTILLPTRMEDSRLS